MKKTTQVLEIIQSREQEAIEHLQRFIQIDTSVIDEGKLGNEGNAQGWIADVFKGMGCKVDVFEPDNEKFKDHIDFTPGHNYEGRPNVAGLIKGAGGGKSLLIDMHVAELGFRFLVHTSDTDIFIDATREIFNDVKELSL